jgi:hypothetical protein
MRMNGGGMQRYAEVRRGTQRYEEDRGDPHWDGCTCPLYSNPVVIIVLRPEIGMLCWVAKWKLRWG